jgi:hypothetical protein
VSVFNRVIQEHQIAIAGPVGAVSFPSGNPSVTRTASQGGVGVLVN